MRLPWRHEDPDRAADGVGTPASFSEVPSAEATDRLAGRLRREIDDLQADLADDLLLTMLLLGEDETDSALGMLDDSSDRLHRFQDRLEGVIAEAAVEREAEAVLASAAADTEDPAERSVSGAFRIRALASAAAAILAAIVGLVSLEPSASPDLLAAGSSSAPAATGASEGSGTHPGDLAAPPSGPSDGDSTVGPTTPRQRLQALIGQQSELLVRLGSEPRRSAVAQLFGVDRLVAQLASEAAEVPSVIASVLPSLGPDDLPTGPSEDAAEQPQQPEPTTEATPTEEPTDEPSPTPTESGSATEDSSEDGSATDGTSDGDEDPTAPGIPGDATGEGSSDSDTSAPSQLLP